MMRQLAHRGPDGEGLHREGPLALAHRRLRIIDLSPRASQPMPNEDQTLWLIHNGEIYNFLELRPALEARGHLFRSASDSEVILHAYEEEGAQCVRQFNGMWAFALWDARRRKLLLSRDRIGEKPLYYCADSREFLFASEIKALLAVRPDLAEPSMPQVAQFLAAGLTDTSEETLFKRVRQLLPGQQILVGEDGTLQTQRYWSAPEPAEEGSLTMEEAAPQFRSLLEDSIKLRLRSDVPVGTCLSGGLDSSSLVALESRLLDSRPIHTFSSVFREAGFAEASFVDALNSAFPTVPHRVSPDPDFMKALPLMLWHQEVPLPGPGVYPQWCVMGLAMGKVTVLLDGQGADELLGGYHYFYADHFADLLRASYRPQAFLQLGLALLRVGQRSGPRETARLLREALRNLQGTARHAGFKSGWFGNSLAPALQREVSESWGPLRRGAGGFLGSVLHEEVTRTSLPTLLHYEDRSAMAHGIETRVPFLDHRLVEFCLRLPGSLRIRAGVTKAMLRHALRTLLPPAVAARKDKLGYPEPLTHWLRGESYQRVSDILLSDRARARGFSNLEVVRRFLEEHRAGANRLTPLYRALTLEVWARLFLDGEGMRAYGSRAAPLAEVARS
jgi:asparagine synthase (glutamine-hydrolysing)